MQKQPYNHAWRFNLGEYPEGRWQEPDDSSWRMVDLPHDWSIELERHPNNPSGNSGGYFPMGRGWYRKTFDAPEGWRGKKVFIEFEGVYMNAEVWLNEHLLGRHPYGYTSFYYDLTPYLNIATKNILKVLVDNACQLNSRWYSGSGIYRPVWLMVADPVHVGHWGISVTTPELSSETATVHISTTVLNETDVTRELTLLSRIFAPDGALVGSLSSLQVMNAGSRGEFSQDLQVPEPRLWSPDTPHLYRLDTEVIVAGEIVDKAETSFGIRSLQIDATHGFLLNGKPLKLKGGCVHHDNGVLGAASYYRSEERKVELHKASGYNAIRCAHNPPAPAFLEACDRLGMLVIDEAFDCWRIGKNYYDYHVAFDDWWQRDINSMIYRDRNHPCVVLWSIGNEVAERDGRSQGTRIARMLAEYVRTLDPTRSVISAINDINEGWSKTDSVFAALDVGGYNYQWRQYLPDHELHPQRVMVGTESFPLEAFDNWMSVLENSFVIGDFVWTSLDYLGESGIGRVHFGGEKEPFLGEYPWHQANCGDLDLCGFKRPQSYYRDVLWQNGDKLFIAVHYPIPEGKTPSITQWGWPDVGPSWTWSGWESQPFKVDVYSACEMVELFLNGISLGIKPTSQVERHIATWEVPYQPGELKAVGYSGGKQIAEYNVKTASHPTQIRLIPDRQTIYAYPGDLCFVIFEILDSQGVVHPNADRTIYFTTQGEGSIAAIGNANPVSVESYRGNQRATYRGRGLVVVKSNGNLGEIRLRAQADGLAGTEVVIRTA